MIANITRGTRTGDIGAYLHGPGKANEHVYTDAVGVEREGGQVIGSNIGAEGQTDPARWVPELRSAQHTRPDIKNPIWHTSLRNTATDRVLSNREWAEIGQKFAERMGYENHPWVMVRHGADHVHIVVSRVDYEGNVWHARNDRRQAQSVCTQLEREHKLEHAPRRKVAPQRTVGEVRHEQRQKAAARTGKQPEPARPQRPEAPAAAETAHRPRPEVPTPTRPRAETPAPVPEERPQPQPRSVREAVAERAQELRGQQPTPQPETAPRVQRSGPGDRKPRPEEVRATSKSERGKGKLERGKPGVKKRPDAAVKAARSTLREKVEKKAAEKIAEEAAKEVVKKSIPVVRHVPRGPKL